jgi:DNA-binding NarL/FixJ family response regulator
VVLTDLRMPEPSGGTLIRLLLERVPQTRILVLTTHDTDSDVLPAVQAGAIGYLLKDAPREELFRAVRAAARGETVLSPSVAALLLARVRPQRPVRTATLSAREREVLALIAQGRTNRETAAALFITEATVKTHLLHIYAKLEVPDRAAAVSAAHRRGLL